MSNFWDYTSSRAEYERIQGKPFVEPSINLYNADIYKHIGNIPDGSIDLILTDPPYLLSGLSGGFAKEAGWQNFQKLIDKHDTLGKGFDFSLLDEFERIQPVLNAYIFCNQKLLNKLICYYESKADINAEILIWHKTNARPQPKSRYNFNIEFILYVHKTGAYLDTTQGFDSRVYTSHIMNSYNKYTTHPTEKTLPLVENLILNSSKQGDTILDCFMGSGTTAHACKACNRNFIGYEIDEEYFKQAQQRLTTQCQGKLFLA